MSVYSMGEEPDFNSRSQNEFWLQIVPWPAGFLEKRKYESEIYNKIVLKQS